MDFLERPNQFAKRQGKLDAQLAEWPKTIYGSAPTDVLVCLPPTQAAIRSDQIHLKKSTCIAGSCGKQQSFSRKNSIGFTQQTSLAVFLEPPLVLFCLVLRFV